MADQTIDVRVTVLTNLYLALLAQRAKEQSSVAVGESYPNDPLDYRIEALERRILEITIAVVEGPEEYEPTISHADLDGIGEFLDSRINNATNIFTQEDMTAKQYGAMVGQYLTGKGWRCQ